MTVYLQGIKGVRFKRVIMDESATDRSPNPPTEDGFQRLVFCSGKVRFGVFHIQLSISQAVTNSMYN